MFTRAVEAVYTHEKEEYGFEDWVNEHREQLVGKPSALEVAEMIYTDYSTVNKRLVDQLTMRGMLYKEESTGLDTRYIYCEFCDNEIDRAEFDNYYALNLRCPCCEHISLSRDGFLEMNHELSDDEETEEEQKPRAPSGVSDPSESANPHTPVQKRCAASEAPGAPKKKPRPTVIDLTQD